MKNRKSLYLKAFIAFIAGTIFIDSLNGLCFHYFNIPATEFIVRPQFAFLGVAFVIGAVLFVLFVKTKWDKPSGPSIREELDGDRI